MPKKRNFLGGMQNYNEKTGEYESALVGPGGKPVEDADGDGKKHESSKGFKSFSKKEEVSEESIESQLKEVHSKLDLLAKKDNEAFVRHLRTGEPYEENEELKELSKKSRELLKQRDELRKNKASENAKKLGRKDFSKEIENFHSKDGGFQKLVGEDRIYAMHQYLEANPYLDPKKVLQNDIIENRDKYPKEFEFKDEKFVVSQSGRAYDHFKKKDGKWEHISVGTIFGLGDDLYDKLKTENLVETEQEQSKIPYDEIDGDYERSWGPVNFDKETNPNNLINFLIKNIGSDDITESFNNASERLGELVKFSDKELDTLMGGTGEEIVKLLKSKKVKSK